RVVDYRFVRTNASDSDEGLLKYVGEDLKYNDADFVPVEVKRGSAVLIHGAAIHKSEPNRSAKSRHAYTFHIIDRQSEHTWSPLNWPQETEDYKFPLLHDY
ncbi:Phytanoyl-CoA dioxygenase, partial [Aphelenchoides avenae]